MDKFRQYINIPRQIELWMSFHCNIIVFIDLFASEVPSPAATLFERFGPVHEPQTCVNSDSSLSAMVCFSSLKACKGELTNFSANARNFQFQAQTEIWELTEMNINAQVGRTAVGDVCECKRSQIHVIK